MADQQSESARYFQVLTLTLLDPLTGDKITRDLIAEALFAPEELDYESYGAGDLKYSMKADPPYYSDKHEQYMDVFHVKLWHPETGDTSERSFICRSFFTPEQLEEYHGIEFEKMFYNMEFRQPYLPHFDDENVAMHRHKTELMRKALAEDND